MELDAEYDHIDFSGQLLEDYLLSGTFTSCYFIQTILTGAELIGSFIACDFSNTDLFVASSLSGEFIDCDFSGALLPDEIDVG